VSATADWQGGNTAAMVLARANQAKPGYPQPNRP